MAIWSTWKIVWKKRGWRGRKLQNFLQLHPQQSPKPDTYKQGTQALSRDWAGTGEGKGQDLSASLQLSRNACEPHLPASTKPSGHWDRGAQQGTSHLPVQTPHQHTAPESESCCLPYPERFVKLKAQFLFRVGLNLVCTGALGGFWVKNTVCWWIRLSTGVLMTLLYETLKFRKVIFKRKGLQNNLKLN